MVALGGSCFGSVESPDSTSLVTADSVPLHPGQHIVAHMSDLSFDPVIASTQDYFETLYNYSPDTFVDYWRGSALVRPSAVPIPAAIWLFATGLLGLVGVARRKERV